MFIYVISNKKNGKRYVGQHAGKDLEKYFERTLWLAENGYQGKRLLYRAIRKHGEENFTVKPLVIVDTKFEMDLYEIGMIKAWDLCNPSKGYNLTQGGGGSFGFRPDEETRQKMSKSRTGLKMTEENRLKLIEKNKGNKYSLGRKMTKENHDKLMKIHVGAKRTDEARKRMSESHKKPWTAKQHFARHKKYHLDRNVVNLECALCMEAQCPKT